MGGQVLKRDFAVLPSLGIVLENVGLYPNLTGLENLRYLANIQKECTREDLRAVLERVGLYPDDKRTYGKYSLGMKQCLAIAQAIMEKPDVLMLDEPTNALDSDAVAQVRDNEFFGATDTLIEAWEQMKEELLQMYPRETQLGPVPGGTGPYKTKKPGRVPSPAGDEIYENLVISQDMSMGNDTSHGGWNDFFVRNRTAPAMQSLFQRSLLTSLEDRRKPCTRWYRALSHECMGLHSTGDLAGTEAAGAHIDVLGGAVHHSLDALDVGLPGTVGAAVGVRNLDAEVHALTTKLTFGHIYKPPRWLELHSYDNYDILPET